MKIFKKFFVSLGVIFILFNMVFSGFLVSANTPTPVKPPKDCPPSYVGQTMCFYVPNPDERINNINNNNIEPKEKKVIVPKKNVPKQSSKPLPPQPHPLYLAFYVVSSVFMMSDQGEAIVNAGLQKVEDFDYWLYDKWIEFLPHLKEEAIIIKDGVIIVSREFVEFFNNTTDEFLINHEIDLVNYDIPYDINQYLKEELINIVLKTFARQGAVLTYENDVVDSNRLLVRGNRDRGFNFHIEFALKKDVYKQLILTHEPSVDYEYITVFVNFSSVKGDLLDINNFENRDIYRVDWPTVIYGWGMPVGDPLFFYGPSNDVNNAISDLMTLDYKNFVHDNLNYDDYLVASYDFDDFIGLNKITFSSYLPFNDMTTIPDVVPHLPDIDLNEVDVKIGIVEIDEKKYIEYDVPNPYFNPEKEENIVNNPSHFPNYIPMETNPNDDIEMIPEYIPNIDNPTINDIYPNPNEGIEEDDYPYEPIDNDPDFSPHPDEDEEEKGIGRKFWDWILFPLKFIIAIYNLLVGFFGWLTSSFVNLIRAISNNIIGIFDFLITAFTDFPTFMSNLMSFLGNFLSNMISNLWEVGNYLGDAIFSIRTTLWDLISQITQPLWDIFGLFAGFFNGRLLGELTTLFNNLFLPSSDILTNFATDVKTEFENKFPDVPILTGMFNQFGAGAGGGMCIPLENYTVDIMGVRALVLDWQYVNNFSDYFRPIMAGLIWLFFGAFTYRRIINIIDSGGDK